MDKNEKSTNIGNFFTTSLLLIFITLKLCKVIKWSWLWVLSPFWIPLSIAIAIGIIYFIVYMLEKIKK